MGPADTLLLNGKPHALAPTVAALLNQINTGGRVAVEVNGQIVPASTYALHRLRIGDQVEIVQAVGGG